LRVGHAVVSGLRLVLLQGGLLLLLAKHLMLVAAVVLTTSSAAHPRSTASTTVVISLVIHVSVFMTSTRAAGAASTSVRLAVASALVFLVAHELAVCLAGTSWHAALGLWKHLVGDRLAGISELSVSVGEVALFSHLAIPIIVEVPAALSFEFTIELRLLLLLLRHRVVHVHHHWGGIHGSSVLLLLDGHVRLVKCGLGVLGSQLGGLVILTAHLGCLHKLLGLLLRASGGGTQRLGIGSQGGLGGGVG
jgi:hypothetical protein